MANLQTTLSVLQKRYTGAKVAKLAPIVVKWEGYYVNDPTDKGGPTNMGITLGTWKQLGYDKNGDGVINSKDIKLLNKNDFTIILKNYWDKWKGDDINNQSIANILVDWYWGSGKWGIVIPQRLLGLKEDGIVGPKTIAAINKTNQKELFDMIFNARVKFLNDIVDSSIDKYEAKIHKKASQKDLLKYTQKRFIKGWLNRLADFKFEA